MAFARKSDVEDAKNHKIEKQGMEYNRMCTDIFFCIFFCLFCVGMIGVSGYALATGEPQKVFTPFDSDGNQCGMPDQIASQKKYIKASDDNATLTDAEKDQRVTWFNELGTRDFSEYKYRVYTNLPKLLEPDFTGANIYQAVCARACPNITVEDAKIVNGKAVLMFDIMATTNFSWGIDSVNASTQNPGEGLFMMEITDPKNMLNLVVLNSTSKENTCVPAVAAEYGEQTDKIYEALFGYIEVGFGSYIKDIGKAKIPLIVMAFVVILITFVYIQLLQCITKPILYGSLFGIFLMLALATFYSYQNFAEYSPDDVDSTDYKFALTILVIFGILTVLYIVLICCLWKAISLGASVMETASDYISDNRIITVIPFAAYIFCAPITLWWVVTAVYIYGLGEPKFVENAFVADMQSSQESTGMFLYEMFGFFWIIWWIISVQLFVTCCSVCLWYFGGHGSDEGDASNKPAGVMISIKWAFRYHLGSLAWGSFLIAIVTTIRVIFEYCVYQYEKAGMKDNVVFQIVTCIIRCYLKCLDCCVKFMNKNAYIQVALHNVSFCNGAKQSFWIIAQNARRFTVVSLTGSILGFLGKTMITITCFFLTQVLTDAISKDVEMIFIPACIIGLFAYMIASIFLSVYDFSALTILHCFCLDESQGTGTRNTPDGLKKFLEKDEEMEKLKAANAVV